MLKRGHQCSARVNSALSSVEMLSSALCEVITCAEDNEFFKFCAEDRDEVRLLVLLGRFITDKLSNSHCEFRRFIKLIHLYVFHYKNKTRIFSSKNDDSTVNFSQVIISLLI